MQNKIKHIGTIQTDTSAIWSVAFNFNGDILASYGTPSNCVDIWNFSDFKLIKSLNKHKEQIATFLFTPNNSYLGSSSLDNDFILWDLKSFSIEKHFKSYTGVLKSISFRRDGRFFCSAIENSINIHESDTGSIIKSLNSNAEIDFVHWSPDGNFIISSDGDMSTKVLDANLDKTIAKFEHAERADAHAFSADGKILAIGAGDFILIVDFESMKIKNVLQNRDDSVTSIVFSFDGKHLVSTHFRGLNPIVIWDYINGDIIATIPDENDVVTSVAYHPYDKIVAVGTGGNSPGMIEFWQLEF